MPVGSYAISWFARGIAVAGEYAYIVDGHEGIHVMNIKDPADILHIADYDTPGSALGISVGGPYVYVADGESGLQVFRFNTSEESATKFSHGTFFKHDASSIFKHDASSMSTSFICVGISSSQRRHEFV